jgi:hypothetical protein
MIDHYGDDVRFVDDELRVERSLELLEAVIEDLKKSWARKPRSKKEKRLRRGVMKQLLWIRIDLDAMHAKTIFAHIEAVALGRGMEPSDEIH